MQRRIKLNDERPFTAAKFFLTTSSSTNFFAFAISFECSMRHLFWWMIDWLTLTWYTISQKLWTPQSNSKCLNQHFTGETIDRRWHNRFSYFFCRNPNMWSLNNLKYWSHHLTSQSLAFWPNGIEGCLDTRGWQFDSRRGVMLHQQISPRLSGLLWIVVMLTRLFRLFLIIGIIGAKISDGLLAIIVGSIFFGLFGLFVFDYFDYLFCSWLYGLFGLYAIIV